MGAGDHMSAGKEEDVSARDMWCRDTLFYTIRTYEAHLKRLWNDEHVGVKKQSEGRRFDGKLKRR